MCDKICESRCSAVLIGAGMGNENNVTSRRARTQIEKADACIGAVRLTGSMSERETEVCRVSICGNYKDYKRTPGIQQMGRLSCPVMWDSTAVRRH